MKVRYIDMDYEEALKLKFESGKAKHRKSGGAKFEGDAISELYEELLDCFHYTVAAEAADPDILPGFRTTFRSMALTLQNRRRELLKHSGFRSV